VNNTINETIRKAVQNQIDNLTDNLYRARLQKRRNPNWRTGNGETIDEVIRGYEHELNEARACLP
jgi:hypothetical protein